MNKHTKKRKNSKLKRIDLGLAVMQSSLPPGSYSDDDIAAWCDCTDSYIWIICQGALKKLKKRFSKDDL